MAVGVGLAMLGLSCTSPYFDIYASVKSALLVCAVIVLPAFLLAKWYGKVVIDTTGISARDTLGRWRTVPWDSLSRVRRLPIAGLPCILLSSPQSKWSVWLPGSLAPHAAFLSTLAEIGPPVAALRANFTSAA
jgi:hypothetical protein